jgi:hypothetical protein
LRLLRAADVFDARLDRFVAISFLRCCIADIVSIGEVNSPAIGRSAHSGMVFCFVQFFLQSNPLRKSLHR